MQCHSIVSQSFAGALGTITLIRSGGDWANKVVLRDVFCCDLPESVSAMFEARHCPKDENHSTTIRPSDDQLPKGGFNNEFDAVELVRVSRQESGAPERWLFPAATPAMPFPIWLGASARPQPASFLNTRCRLTYCFANRNIIDASRRFPSVQRLPEIKCQPELRPFAV